MKRSAWLLVVAACVAVGACSKKQEKAAGEAPAESPAAAVETLKEYPIASLEGVLTRTGVSFDSTTSADGNGSIKVTTDGPATIRLFETGDIDVDDARIIYRAHLRTEGVEGNVYLEMLCSFPGIGEAFSRALQAPLTGTVEWTSQETPFFLNAGENPDNVKLNLVIDGKGTAWIDEVTLTRGPLGDI
jgi:hypothetical protein